MILGSTKKEKHTANFKMPSILRHVLFSEILKWEKCSLGIVENIVLLKPILLEVLKVSD